ncbi:MAG: hypothetical protein M9963_06935 [Kiritimatiellae bacterium]|nr:hypothetical protein [Kiritimatiellia bacterium]MCO5061724.1 hypothetical protein [Kiritimatiellia bacterium]MCO5069451.1 hypothetical protein [Kiritimatiellia bacterium]
MSCTRVLAILFLTATGVLAAPNHLRRNTNTSEMARFPRPTFGGAYTSIPIFVTVVTHTEQTTRYDLLPAAFESARTNTYLFASMLAEHGVQYDFQSDWTFLAAVTNFDKTGHAETGGTNIVKWIEDLGFSIDPHNHVGQSSYNSADLAALITLCGATPSPVVGGFLAYPITNSQWALYQHTMTGAVYTATTWTAGTMWGGGSGSHSLDTNTWFSGVYCPRDATNYWQHKDGNLPDIGTYGGRYQAWTNLDMLLAMRSAGLLCTGSIYTCTIMAHVTDLTPAYIADFDAQLQDYTNRPNIRWVNLVQLTNIWATEYGRRPSRLPWVLTNDYDADGIIDGWEVSNFCGTCEIDGTQDDDGDGWSDSEEFTADTQPTNSSSAYSNNWSAVEDYSILDIYNSSAGRLYTVESTTNLVETNWTPVITDVPGNGGLLQITLTNTLSSQFYRSIVARP